MDTISMMDDDPTLPIDFDQSTNLLQFLAREKSDGSDSRGESLLSPEPSNTDAVADGKTVQNNPVNNDPNSPERGTLKEHEEIISTFKKENFGLKLRIYFLEERLQMAYEGDTEDILKTNIELKVNIEQLKKEVTEKQQLLIKASKAMETITSGSEQHINKLQEEFTKQYNEMRDELQREIDTRDKNLKQNVKIIEELDKKLDETEKSKKQLEENFADLKYDPKIIENLNLKQKEMEEKYEKQLLEKDLKYAKELQEKEIKIQQLAEMNNQMRLNPETQTEVDEMRTLVAEKDNKIQELREELRALASQSPDRQNQHYGVLYDNLEAKNAENENKIKELSKELRKKTSLVEELKDYINKTDRVNKELRNSIHDKETEKHRSSTSLQEHIRWKLNNRLRDLLSSVRLDLALSGKEKEVIKCRSQIEKLEELTEKLQKELAEQEKMNGLGSKDSHEKLEAIAALRAELQEKDLLLKKYKQTMEDKDRELLYFNNAKVRAEQDLQNGISQKNNEIQAINERLKKLVDLNREKLMALEEQCQKLQEDSQLKLNEKDKLIQRLSNALRNKDILIQDLATPQERTDQAAETLQDKMSQLHIIDKLRAKLNDMDQAMEASLDEKFRVIAEKDKELLEMKRQLRDKDHEIEMLKANVSACEGVIKHLENICSEKDATMQDLKKALETQEKSFRTANETLTRELEDCQLNILKLSRLLDAKENEINEMQKYFIQNGSNLDDGGVKAIQDQLDARQKLIEELTSERDAAVNRNEINKQKFISALNAKDSQIKDAFGRMARLSEEKNDAIKQLKALVEQKNQEITMMDKKLEDKNSEGELFVIQIQKTGDEKDQAIEKLAKSGQEKDRLISELQERLHMKPSQSSDGEAMEGLKKMIRKADDEIRKKEDELSELKSENKRLREKHENQQRSENIEITMKFDNMKSELDEKERQLKDARDELWNMQREMEKVTSLAESLQKKLHALEGEKDDRLQQVEDWKRKLKEKDEALEELQKDRISNLELSGTLNKIQDQKAHLETQLKDLSTEIESLKAAIVAMEKNLVQADDTKRELTDKLEEALDKLKSSARELENMRAENYQLKSELERGSRIPQRDERLVGAGTDEVDTNELRDLLKMQVQEQQKLFQATEQERMHYVKLIEDLKNNSSPVSRNAELDFELQSISSLRSQYEESVRQSESLRHHLENEIKLAKESTQQPSESKSQYQDEISNLKRKLEESESWNKSLQFRLDQLLPRAGGVGASEDRVDGAGVQAVENQDDKAMLEKCKQEQEAMNAELRRQREQCSSLHQQLQQKSRDLAEATKTLTEFKVHYEKFAQLRSKEVETLTSNCENAKRVAKELENQIKELRKESQIYKQRKQEGNDSLTKQIESLGDVNDVLRKALNEKTEEWKIADAKALEQEHKSKRLERTCQLLTSDKKLLMDQIQDKNGQLSKLRKELENLKIEIKGELEQNTRKTKDNKLLQEERNELRELNERLRNKLGEVSTTYENLKGTNEHEIVNLTAELKHAKLMNDELRHDNDEANAINMRLRDEIRNLQEASRDLQRLTDDLKSSQNVNKVLQRQLNDLSKASELRKNALEPEIETLKRKMQDLQRSNHELEEKALFYQRQAAGFQQEYQREKDSFDSEKAGNLGEIGRLKNDILALNKLKLDWESKLKELSFESESYKAMIERLEEDNSKKQNMISRLEEEVRWRSEVSDKFTTMTPQKRVSMISQTTPNRMTSEAQRKEDLENSMQEALQIKDACIEELRKQVEFYKQEKEEIERQMQTTRNRTTPGARRKEEFEKSMQEALRNKDACIEELRKQVEFYKREKEEIERQMQTTPNRTTPEAHRKEALDNSMKEALQKRDAYIEALRKQIEFYKQEKSQTEQQKKARNDQDSSNNNNLIALHIAEMRELRKELEQSIRNNDALRAHLEYRLSEAEKEVEKFKDPNLRGSLLRENDNLRAQIAEKEMQIKELTVLMEKIQQDDQSSTGQMLEKDNQIKQLQIKLEKRNTEFERMQMFAPQGTSSTLPSPVQSMASFTQTTPIKLRTKLNKEIQVDTFVAEAASERQRADKRIKALADSVNEKEKIISNLEMVNDRLKGSYQNENRLKSEIECCNDKLKESYQNEMRLKSEIEICNDRVKNSSQNEIKLKSEIESCNRLLVSKDEIINTLESKIKDLESSLNVYENESSVDAEKRATNNELIALHISEMRKLKEELELSIKNNDELRLQLENRLSMIEKDAQNLKDPNLRINLIRDNDILRTQSNERQNVILRQKTSIEKLMSERKSDKENIKKLHQQIHNLNRVTSNLKEEVSLYDRLQEHLSASAARNQTKSNSPAEPEGSKYDESDTKFDASLLQMLLEEIRNLRVQLQRSIDANIALREKLEEQLGRSLNTSSFGSLVTTAGADSPSNPNAKDTVRRALFESTLSKEGAENEDAKNQLGNIRPRFLSQEAPTRDVESPGSRSYFMSPTSLAAVVNEAKDTRLFVRGKLEEYIVLKNKLANCCQRVTLMQDFHVVLQTQKQVGKSQMNELQVEAGRVLAELKECCRLVDLMWTEENPGAMVESTDSYLKEENQQLKSEVVNLKQRLAYQDKLIKSSLQRLEESNKVKGDLEQQILGKLKTTHGTMIKASQNLEDKIVKAKTPPKKSRQSPDEMADSK